MKEFPNWSKIKLYIGENKVYKIRISLLIVLIVFVFIGCDSNKKTESSSNVVNAIGSNEKVMEKQEENIYKENEVVVNKEIENKNSDNLNKCEDKDNITEKNEVTDNSNNEILNNSQIYETNVDPNISNPSEEIEG